MSVSVSIVNPYGAPSAVTVLNPTTDVSVTVEAGTPEVIALISGGEESIIVEAPGPQGPPGTPAINLWEKKMVTVPSMSTVAVDTAPLTSFSGCEYFLKVHDQTQGKRKTLKMVIDNGADGMTDQVYGKSGDSLNTQINAIGSGLNFMLNITNNEPCDIDVTMVRLFI